LEPLGPKDHLTGLGSWDPLWGSTSKSIHFLLTLVLHMGLSTANLAREPTAHSPSFRVPTLPMGSSFFQWTAPLGSRQTSSRQRSLDLTWHRWQLTACLTRPQPPAGPWRKANGAEPASAVTAGHETKSGLQDRRLTPSSITKGQLTSQAILRPASCTGKLQGDAGQSLQGFASGPKTWYVDWPFASPEPTSTVPVSPAWGAPGFAKFSSSDHLITLRLGRFSQTLVPLGALVRSSSIAMLSLETVLGP
jgi:hypothetical protein